MATASKPRRDPATCLDIYAKGGDVVTTRSRFMKAPNVFRTDIERTDYGKKSKGGEFSKLAGDTKSQKPVKPRD